MSKTTLTDVFAEKAKSQSGKPQTDYFDTLCVGLALRVTSAGRKSWTVSYTTPGTTKRARATLGTYPVLSLKDARTKATELRQQVDGGIDPRTVVEAKPVEKMMAQLIEDRLVLEIRESLNPATGEVVRKALRTAKMIEWRFNKYVIPIVGRVPVKDFRVRHLNLVLDPIKARGKRRIVKQVFADLRTLFGFAINREEVDFSPLAQVKVDKGSRDRKRFLSLEEIQIVWSELPTVFAKSPKVIKILQLKLALGQRLTEYCGMRREEIDPVKRIWTIPGSRVKTSADQFSNEENLEIPHVVPLNDLAWSIISDLLKSTNGDFLFPNDKGDNHYHYSVVDQIVRRANMTTPKHPNGKFGIPKWTPHDLRRTVSTQMVNISNGLSISRFDKAQVVNHRTETKATVDDRVYDQNDYFEEKKVALDKWGAFLMKLVTVEEQREAA